MSASLGVHPRDFCVLLIQTQAKNSFMAASTTARDTHSGRKQNMHADALGNTRPTETTMLSVCIIMILFSLILFVMLFVPEVVSVCASALAHDE